MSGAARAWHPLWPDLAARVAAAQPGGRLPKPNADGWLGPLRSPLRDDEHPSFSVKPDSETDPGAYVDHAIGDKGSMADLARCLGLELGGNGRARPAAPTLAGFAEARRLTVERLTSVWDVRQVVHAGRPALRFPTVLGVDRIKYLDGAKPKCSWAASGKGHAHCYGLAEARRIGGEVLDIVNGEVSVWGASQAGVPAVCFCVGEDTAPSAEVIAELQASGFARFRVVYDRDKAGRDGAPKVVAALRAAGLDAVALELPADLGEHGDVDDLHQRVGDRLGEVLAGLPEMVPAATPPAVDQDAGATADTATSDPQNPFEDAVSREVLTLRVRAEAKRRVAAECGTRRPFDAALLQDVEDEAVRWRAEGLLATGGRMLLSAQRKTGKTITALNLSRDLILGGAFLGRFRVAPVTGRVAFLNFEVARAQAGRWGREVGVPGHRLLTVHLRGCPNPFADVEDTARLVVLMREFAVEVVIVDPFGRAYPGKSQNDAGEVGAWLSDLDRFVTAAGASELILTAHAGWDGERTRGTTALEDWADTVAYLVKDKEDEHVRYFRAIGRDVEVEEDRLEYDPVTRRLTLAGSGSRATARVERRTEELVEGVVEAVTREPGATTGRLGVLMREAGLGLQRGEAGRAARAAADAGRIVCKPGSRRSVLHFPKGAEADYSRVVPTSPGGTLGVVPTRTYRDGTTPVLVEAPMVPGPVNTKTDRGKGNGGVDL